MTLEKVLIPGALFIAKNRITIKFILQSCLFPIQKTLYFLEYVK